MTKLTGTEGEACDRRTRCAQGGKSGRLVVPVRRDAGARDGVLWWASGVHGEVLQRGALTRNSMDESQKRHLRRHRRAALAAGNLATVAQPVRDVGRCGVGSLESEREV